MGVCLRPLSRRHAFPWSVLVNILMQIPCDIHSNRWLGQCII
jgi:hypothetical protein